MRQTFSRIALIYILLFGTAVLSADRRDFMIIGSPEKAELYNQYELPLSNAESRALVSGVVFEIKNANQLMGDQIRRGMYLSHFNTAYYLILDDNGKTVGLPPSAHAKTFRNGSPLYDTVMVSISAIKVYERYPSQGKTAILKRGTRVIRIFRYRKATYLYRISSPGEYGWTHVSSSSFKRDISTAREKDSDFTFLHERIIRRLSQINSRYDSLFTFFNKVSGQSKATPKWTWSQKGSRHEYALSGADQTVNQLAQSTRYIVGEIEKILLGKPFSVTFSNRIIAVEPR